MLPKRCIIQMVIRKTAEVDCVVSLKQGGHPRKEIPVFRVSVLDSEPFTVDRRWIFDFCIWLESLGPKRLGKLEG